MNDFLKASFWRKHGLSFLLAALSLIALIAALLVHSQAQDALQASKNSYQQQQAVNLEAEQAAAVLTEYLPPYKAFQEQGFIGPPQRLQWLETLYASVNHHMLPLTTFTISPTAIANETNTTYVDANLAMKVTPMRIDFSLLHEGDFYHLLTAMQTQAKGLYSAQRCEIRRTDEEAAGFKGQCDLLWYSLADITRNWEVVNDK